MGQPRAKTGANLRPNRANIGQQQQHHHHHNNNNARSGWRVCFCWRPAVRRKPHKSGQGPHGRGIAEGVSLLSVGERGRRPTTYRQKPPRFTVFRALPIFSHVSAFVAQDGSTLANIGFKMGQHSPKMGPHSPQDGPTWPKLGQHSPKKGQHSPQDGPT